MLLPLVGGLCLYHLRRRQRRPITGLDLAIGSFTLGLTLIPLLFLFVTGSPNLGDLDTMRTVLIPIQFLMVYMVFSRTDLSSGGMRSILNLTLLASVLVGLLAVLELLDVPGVRSLVQATFPPPPLVTTWDPLYRPTSTLGHFSAVGAYGTLNFTLALALATMRHPAFPKLWLSLVMAVNLAALAASLTWAPLVAAPLVTGIVLWYGRRIPRELGLALAALALALALFWPAVSARGAQQGVLSSVGTELVIPWTFEVRLRFWEAFFVPSLLDHVWLGTGTVIPSEVPDRLVDFVDNEYLREGFRAGLVGIGLLLTVITTIGVIGWRSRASPDVTRRSLGGAIVALAVFYALIGLTAEYLFFGGVSQEFAMLLGFLGLSQPLRAAVAWPAQVPAAPALMKAAAT
jgi:hypothetical protein